jgi:hypothetical protein
VAATANSLPYGHTYSVYADPLTPTREATIRYNPKTSTQRPAAHTAFAHLTRRLRKMARTSSTRAKRASNPDPEEPEEPFIDAAVNSDDESLFPSPVDEDNDKRPRNDNVDYDEAADEVLPCFNRNDNPEYTERERALKMYTQELKFKRSVALALYRDQGLDDANSFLRLKDDTINRMILAIRKEDPTLLISIPAIENLKLLVYYLKHRQRTSRPYERV